MLRSNSQGDHPRSAILAPLAEPVVAYEWLHTVPSNPLHAMLRPGSLLVVSLASMIVGGSSSGRELAAVGGALCFKEHSTLQSTRRRELDTPASSE